MDTEAVLDEFRGAGALLEGHFILSSGLHSPVFLQKALVFQYANRTERLCKALAEKVKAELEEMPEVIISPAVGGIVPGYETARWLGVPAMFTEREEGTFRLRRGFSVSPGTRVLVVEDIVTTGLSSRECIEAIQAEGGHVVAEACIVDRSGGRADLGVPLISLAQVDFPAYEADKLPPELSKLPAIKPGSRDLSKKAS
jgi:orotate phosphoribosyltransferase